MSYQNKKTLHKHKEEIEVSKRDDEIKAEVQYLSEVFKENEKSEEAKKVYWREDIGGLKSQLSDFFNERQAVKERV